MLPDILEDGSWQMSPGERAAIKGLLGDLKPRVAIEIGTGTGGSLRRIAAASGHVHAFDITAPGPELARLPNVTFHSGDSHELLPRVLEELATAGTTVDFVLVDGDHGAEGVKRDVEDLLSSPAIARTLIVLHDTANPEVRAGLEAIEYTRWTQLVWVDLDWVPGFMFQDGPARGEAWSGLGLMVVDRQRSAEAGPPSIANYAFPAARILAEHRTTLETSSARQRLRRPLRAVGARLRRQLQLAARRES